jgi:hypothetical protein
VIDVESYGSPKKPSGSAHPGHGFEPRQSEGRESWRASPERMSQAVTRDRGQDGREGAGRVRGEGDEAQGSFGRRSRGSEPSEDGRPGRQRGVRSRSPEWPEPRRRSRSRDRGRSRSERRGRGSDRRGMSPDRRSGRSRSRSREAQGSLSSSTAQASNERRFLLPALPDSFSARREAAVLLERACPHGRCCPRYDYWRERCRLIHEQDVESGRKGFSEETTAYVYQVLRTHPWRKLSDEDYMGMSAAPRERKELEWMDSMVQKPLRELQEVLRAPPPVDEEDKRVLQAMRDEGILNKICFRGRTCPRRQHGGCNHYHHDDLAGRALSSIHREAVEYICSQEPQDDAGPKATDAWVRSFVPLAEEFFRKRRGQQAKRTREESPSGEDVGRKRQGREDRPLRESLSKANEVSRRASPSPDEGPPRPEFEKQLRHLASGFCRHGPHCEHRARGSCNWAHPESLRGGSAPPWVLKQARRLLESHPFCALTFEQYGAWRNASFSSPMVKEVEQAWKDWVMVEIRGMFETDGEPRRRLPKRRFEATVRIGGNIELLAVEV